jgi:hypothetical protein
VPHHIKTVVVALLRKVSLVIRYMKKHNRDLLILRKEEVEDQTSIEQEIISLNTLLQSVEMSESICQAYEFFDLNNYKISHKASLISRALNAGALKPFQFLINRN